ncbi:class I SAM-dependent methyltransferase [Amycolatopsis nigrescens]|uniref:class I SAM-dependent methyltransferase n=1 Tax=Amycolatopsis nigrescens TaxID=381445 RepID=UPI0003A709BB|nr:methyltransferase domain-containing protein [Amycolatopsis nigrescens]
MTTTTESVTSVMALSVQSEGVFPKAIGGAQDEPGSALDLEMLLAGEIMLHEHDPGNAESEFRELRASPVPADVEDVLEDLRDRYPNRLFLVHRGSLIAFDEEQNPIADLTELSRETRQVLRCAGMQQGLVQAGRPPEFGELLDRMARRGFVAPAPGALDWGHLRRLKPICPAFGFSRGTPIDRYYLDEFIEEIRGQVIGDVLEIGGRDGNRETYGFDGATTYRSLDISEAPGVSVVGDAADPHVVPASSQDAVIAFNVLEHTPRPWRIVDNMHRWLRPGGTAFCMVPSAQRLHRAPEDYWRPLPAAMREMFADWSEIRPYQYGNPLTTIAAFLGIAADELSPAELGDRHPDYPVATCIVARK